MLVIAAVPTDGDLLWRGRRHDDDGPGAVRGHSAADLFDAVFHALHDGEQVAVGFPAPLTVAAGPAVDELLTAAERDSPAVWQLVLLLAELGRWRPWTVVSTSLPRWRATTSVLVWETVAAESDAAVDALFDLARDGADRGAERAGAAVTNLAVVAALRAGLTVDEAQLREPLVRVSPRSAGG